jgi:hypothetical protein
MIAMELNCGACKETGIVLDCHRGEESVEVESGGVIEGLRGFQGEPRLGLPLGRVMENSVQLAEKTKTTRCREITWTALLQREGTEVDLRCNGRSFCSRHTEVSPKHNERSHSNSRRGGKDWCVNAPSHQIKTPLNAG